MKKTFNSDSLSSEELDKEIDEFLDFIRPYFIEWENKTKVVDKNRIEQLELVCYEMVMMTKNKGITVTYDLDEPDMLVGGVYVEGRALEFDDTKWFAKVASLADNMDVSPLVSGGVSLVFSFRGLAF